MMQTPISVTITVSEDDIINFVRRNISKQHKFKKYYIYIAFFLIFLNSYNLYKSSSNLNSFLHVFVFGLIFFLGWQYTIRSSAKNIYKNRKEDFAYTTYTFSEDKLEVKSANGEAKLNWSSILKIEEDKDLILLFTTPQQAYILPKRCFKDVETIQAVIQLVRNGISNKK